MIGGPVRAKPDRSLAYRPSALLGSVAHMWRVTRRAPPAPVTIGAYRTTWPGRPHHLTVGMAPDTHQDATMVATWGARSRRRPPQGETTDVAERAVNHHDRRCVREGVGGMGEVEDAVLLRRAARGDGEAFAELYDRLAPMVMLRLRRRCADEDMVADVVQETFTAAWRAASSWDGRGDVAAWVWTIAARRLVDAFRRRAVRPALAWDACAAESDHGDTAGVWGARSVSAEEQVMNGLLAGPLEAAIAGLSPELRAVLQATVLDGLSVREAAVVLGVAEGTVKSRAMRARTKLRQALA